jgi:hypothetical protein
MPKRHATPFLGLLAGLLALVGFASAAVATTTNGTDAQAAAQPQAAVQQAGLVAQRDDGFDGFDDHGGR